MSETRQFFGKKNEKLAEKFLRKKGHRILERNYLVARLGEIDLITEAPGKIIAFVEVRSKHDVKYGHPLETINEKKIEHIRQAASHFLYAKPQYQSYACRFDVITIVGEGRDKVLEYYPDAF